MQVKLIPLLAIVITLFSAVYWGEGVSAVSADLNRDLDAGILYLDQEDGRLSFGGACGLVGDDNEEMVWNYLIGKGLSVKQAAGAMGNLKREANFNPKLVEQGGLNSEGDWVYGGPSMFPSEMEEIPPTVGPQGQPGYGIVQWTSPSRKKGLQDFSDKDPSNRPVYDLLLQLEYMWSELETPYYKERALDPLLASTTLEEATRIWQDKYEVGRHFEPRFKFAQEILDNYGSGTTVGVSNTCVSSGNWVWPLDPVGTISSCFGPRIAPTTGASSNHKGLDIIDGSGKILAADAGKVTHAGVGASGLRGGLGRFVVIEHSSGSVTRYGHASSVLVSNGDTVEKGQHIANEGTTGVSTGVHLHFEILIEGTQINPLNELEIPEGVVNRGDCTPDATSV